MQSPPSAPLAALPRRLACLVYDGLLLTAVLWFAALPLQLVEAGMGASHSRPLFQAYLVVIAGIYFVWQWVRSGQTLAMKTWRLRLVDAAGRRITLPQALLRYVLAVAGVALAGVGFIWGFFDPQRQFLHDRLARTRIVHLTERPLR